jgi:predicted transcriptional regulator
MEKEEQKSGFAKAFKRDVGKEDEVAKQHWPVSVTSSILMNEMRKKIFLLLCKSPASHLRVIAQNLGVSSTTASWHLKKLLQSQFITQRTIKKKSVYYPTFLIEPEEVELFSLLAAEKYRNLYKRILKSPGINQKSLSKELDISHQSVLFLSKKLLSFGLISKLSDGKFIRYYPTDLLETRSEEMKKRNKAFRIDIIKVLKQDGLDPKLIKRTDNFLLVDLLIGSERERVRIETNPYRSTLIDD